LHHLLELAGVGQYSRRTLVTGWSCIGLTFVVVMGTLFGYVEFRSLLDGIKHEAVTDLGKRPPKYNDALNLLLIGSDSRSGKNGAIGGRRGISGQRSDTVMIVHISPGRKRIYVLSFPRDTVVPILQCDKDAGDGFATGQLSQPGQVEQLNSTFAYGGPSCLWKTLEHTTDIRIDDFIQLNFTGFISVINALGGVEVCLPTAIHPSSYDQLNLTAGRHFLYGRDALEFWRLREDFGLGSDLQRIQRDQLLMVGLVQRILKTGVLHSPAKTYSIVSAIVHAHALTTDNGLTAQKLLAIGESMSGISRKQVQFIEVPSVEYPNNPNWVEFDPAQAPDLFSAVAHDTKLPKLHKPKKSRKAGKKTAKGKGTSGRQAQADSKTPKLLNASQVSVEVLNGSGTQGIAGTTADALTAKGFHVLGASSALTPSGTPDFSYVKSVVQYSSAADLAAARTVAAQLTNVTLQLDSSVTPGTVNLVLGSDFKSLGGGKQGQSAGPGNLASQFNGYTGGTNVCKGYGNAFASS
jgi:LCP family protein required for cell wall assembly